MFGRDSISQAFRFPRRELFLPWTAGSALSIKERPNDYYVTGSGDTIVRGLPPPAEQVWRSFGHSKGSGSFPLSPTTPTARSALKGG